jgi:hypothetical protein
MEKLFKQIGDQVIEYTEAEYAQAEIDKIENAKVEAEMALKVAAKTAAEAKLAALGLTTEDLKALGI